MNTRLLLIAGILGAFAAGLVVSRFSPGATTPLLIITVLVIVVLCAESFNLWPKTSSSTAKRKTKKLPANRVSRARR